MSVKTILKTFYTFFFHPYAFIYLSVKNKARRIFIDRGMRINKLKYLKIGNNLSIGHSSRFLFVEKYYGESYTPAAFLGNNITIGSHFSLLSAAPIFIDDNCLIASYVLISSENHSISLESGDSYTTLPLEAKPVHIGKGCWIGEKAVILPGVTLGDRVIVGAGSVVTKSFPSACIIAGNPAKIIKQYDFDSHSWQKVN